MDTSALPLLGAPERIILRTSDRKDFFDDRFAASAAAAAASAAATAAAAASGDEGLRSMPSLESLASVLRSPSVGTAASASREDVASLSGGGGGGGSGGAGGRSSRANTVSSVGDDGRSSWSHGHGYAPPVPGSGSGQVPYLAPSRQDSTATRSASSLVGSSGSPTVLRGHHGLGNGAGAGAAARPKDTHFFETKIAYNGIALPVRIPMATFPSEVGDVRPPLPRHLLAGAHFSQVFD